MEQTPTDAQADHDRGMDDGAPRAIAHTYRYASRRVRRLAAQGTDPKALSRFVQDREQAYYTLLVTGHGALARALVEEDAFFLRIQACREQGGEHTDLRTELHTGIKAVWARIRVLLYGDGQGIPVV